MASAIELISDYFKQNINIRVEFDETPGHCGYVMAPMAWNYKIGPIIVVNQSQDDLDKLQTLLHIGGHVLLGHVRAPNKTIAEPPVLGQKVVRKYEPIIHNNVPIVDTSELEHDQADLLRILIQRKEIAPGLDFLLRRLRLNVPPVNGVSFFDVSLNWAEELFSTDVSVLRALGEYVDPELLKRQILEINRLI